MLLSLPAKFDFVKSCWYYDCCCCCCLLLQALSDFTKLGTRTVCKSHPGTRFCEIALVLYLLLLSLLLLQALSDFTELGARTAFF